MSAPYEVRKVRHLSDFWLRVSFADGTEGDIDFSVKLQDPGPMFEPLLDESFFAQAAVDAEIGTVVWPNGADFAPDVLYAEVNGS